jgi:hypothetical protein
VITLAALALFLAPVLTPLVRRMVARAVPSGTS